MKKHLFTFYGCEVTITVPKELKDIDWPTRFEDWLNTAKEQAIYDYEITKLDKYGR